MKRNANHYTDVETLPSYAKATAAIQIPLSAGLVRLANSKIQNLSLTNMERLYMREFPMHDWNSGIQLPGVFPLIKLHYPPISNIFKEK